MGPRELTEVGIAERALEGGVSGDRAVVVERDDGTLVAAIDGVGHGPLAGEAADVAAGMLERLTQASLERLFAECHRALKRTRGAVMTVALFGHDGSMRWAGVGNVEARLMRPGPELSRAESPVLFGGVLGHQMRTVRESQVSLSRGDLVVMATDGVRADFSSGLSPVGSAAAVAERVLQRSAKAHDDALVVVVRWHGGG